MPFPYTIAFCCNGSLLPGLHGTLASAVRHLSERDKVALHLFYRDIDAASLEEIRSTITKAGDVADVQFREIDLAEFKDLRTLHGDQMTYLKFKLADFLPDVSTLLYLDSDLAVDVDVCPLFAVSMGDCVLGAVTNEWVQWCIDREFLSQVGLTDQDRYFNAGVLLFNADRWRAEGHMARALEFARVHSTSYISHDQSVLNALFSRTFFHLPEQFNHIVQPQEAVGQPKAEIYHFLGSPKPWDPLGRLMHCNYHLWDEAIRHSSFRWSTFLQRYGSQYAKRAWALRKSYLRETKNHLKMLLKAKRSAS